MLCLLAAVLCVAQSSPTTQGAAGPAGPVGPYLYLLSGTPTQNAINGFPMRLYAASGARLALVRQVSTSLFAVANDLSGHLYVLDIGLRSLNVIHENAPREIDVVSPLAGSGSASGFSFYDQTWGAVAGAGVAPGVVYADWTNHWTVTRIFGNAIPGQPRIVPGTWRLYRYFQYLGSGGGPYSSTSTQPGGTIDDAEIMAPYTLGPGAGYLGPKPPFLPSQAGVIAGYPDRPRGASVVADTAHFFAIYAPLPTAPPQSPRTVYVLNKAAGRWSVIKLPFYYSTPRLFGAWLAAIVAEPNPQSIESPGLENERANEVDANTPTGVVRELPRVRGMYPQDVYMPGKLFLQNLVDERKITIEIGQQDSEVLAIRSDGLVLYRVNDSIFEAHIEGDKLSAPTLVVKGDDVPEIHWAFWSNASPKPPPPANPPTAQ
ncbi:MAG: hypothetical protein ACRD11_05555 [Terriglobia bacterium]